MSSYYDTIPKVGTIIKLNNNITLKVIPNLAQIITQQDSCKGCYFDEWEEAACGLHRSSLPDEQRKCVGCNGDVDKQIIYVKEEP